MDSMVIQKRERRWNKLKDLLGIDQSMMFSNEEMIVLSPTRWNLSRIPQKDRTEEMIMSVFEYGRGGDVLSLVPRNMITKDMARLQVHTSPSDFKHIPAHMYDEDMIERIIQAKDVDIWELTLILDWVCEDSDLGNTVHAYYIRALDMDVEVFTAMSGKYITGDMVDRYLSTSESPHTEYIPKRFWKQVRFRDAIGVLQAEERKQDEINALRTMALAQESAERERMREEQMLMRQELERDPNYIHPQGDRIVDMGDGELSERYEAWAARIAPHGMGYVPPLRSKILKSRGYGVQYESLGVCIISNLNIADEVLDNFESLLDELKGLPYDTTFLLSNVTYSDRDELKAFAKKLPSRSVALLDSSVDGVVTPKDFTRLNHRGRWWYTIPNHLAQEYPEDFIELMGESSLFITYGDSAQMIHDMVLGIPINTALFIGEHLDISIDNGHHIRLSDISETIFKLSLYGVYDPYLGYTDGAYEVSKESYVDYYKSMSMGTFRPNVSMIPKDISVDMLKGLPIMLVRGNTKMFFMRTPGGKSILFGGAKRSAKRTLMYYYDNMIEYQSTLSEILKPLLDDLVDVGLEYKMITSNTFTIGAGDNLTLNVRSGIVEYWRGSPRRRYGGGFEDMRIGDLYHSIPGARVKNLLMCQPLVNHDVFKNDIYQKILSSRSTHASIFKEMVFIINTNVVVSWVNGVV